MPYGRLFELITEGKKKKFIMENIQRQIMKDTIRKKKFKKMKW